jgi:phage tail-like protein
MSLSTGRQPAATGEQKGEVLASALFIVEVEGKTLGFSELAGIVSEVEQAEYMEAGVAGATFSRHFGKTKPPTVTLKRAMSTGDGTTWVWAWHQLARTAAPTAYKECTLKLFSAGDDPSGPGRLTYLLVNAWPTKVEIAGMKAGTTEVVIQTLTLMCDEMFDPNA